MARRLVAASLGIFGVSSAASASADETNGAPPIQLVFDVDAALTSQCPDRDHFEKLLLAERPRLVLLREYARRFDIHVRRGASGKLTGELVVTERDGASSARNVEARDCRTLARALAVVAALASDVVPEPEEASEPAPTLTLTPPPTPPTVDVPPPAIVTPRSTPRPPRVPQPTLALGAGAEVVRGALPRTAVGYRAYFEGQKPFGETSGTVRASLAFAQAALPGTTAINVFVQLWTARVEACAGRHVLDAFAVEACASGTTGVMHSYSTGSIAARDDVRPWLTFGPALRGRWELGGGFHAEIFGNTSYVAKVYTTIARDGSSASYRIPRVIGEIGLGLGRSFDR